MTGRRLALSIVSLLLAACGSPVAVSHRSASPTAASSVAISALPTAAISPTQTPLEISNTPPPPVPAGASCKLPVASPDAPVDGNPADGSTGHGGFLSWPAGVFTADASSMGSYDAVAGKWLPVPSAWVAPNGATYAYARGATVHVVSVTDGADKQFTIPSSVQVVAYDSAGIYLEQAIPNSDAPPSGLGLLNPVTGAYSQLVPDGWYPVEHAGLAYNLQLNTFYGQPPQDGPKPVGNELFRIEPPKQLGLISVMAIPDAALQVVGFDGGDQPVLSARSGSYYRIYTAASIRTGGTPSAPAGPPAYEGLPTADTNPTGPAQGDAHGVWFGSASGAIWLYSPSNGMRKVADLSWRSPVIAGTCR